MTPFVIKGIMDHKMHAMSIPDTKKKITGYTHKQGQYLAFIYYYTKINGQAPAQADLQRYFQVSPPSVHRMLTQLADKGLIRKQPGVARSLSVLMPLHQLPELD